MKGLDLEKRARGALLDCLRQAPFLSVGAVQAPSEREGADFELPLETPDGDWILVAEVKDNGQPRIVRDAAHQVRRYVRGRPRAYGVFIAPFVSEQGARICSEECIGYADLAGNCRLAFGQTYIERKGQPNPYANRRSLRSLYQLKASRVLRVMLTQPKRRWKVQDLAHEAGVSLGHVHNVKVALADREWLVADKDGFVLSRPEALLKEWAANYDYRKHVVLDYYSLDDVPTIERRLADAQGAGARRIALTSFSAAARLAPFVKQQRVFAYVGEDAESLATALGLKRVESGPNVTLLAPNDEGVFYGARDFDGIPIVAPVQAYLDLSGFRGRGEEAAEHLLEKVISPQW